MPKKSVKPVRIIRKSVNSSNIDKVLVDNFVALQRVMTNLSLKFDDLSKKISKLLDLFEISAKAIVEKDYNFHSEGSSKKENSELIEKLDKLLDQNRILAKGVSLLHDSSYDDSEEKNEEVEEAQKEKVGGVNPVNVPVVSTNDGRKGSAINMGDYEKSISSKPDSEDNLNKNPNSKSEYRPNDNYK